MTSRLFVQSEDVVMKMEFGDGGESSGPAEELGLAARLTKKTKENGWNSSILPLFRQHFHFMVHHVGGAQEALYYF